MRKEDEYENEHETSIKRVHVAASLASAVAHTEHKLVCLMAAKMKKNYESWPKLQSGEWIKVKLKLKMRNIHFYFWPVK